MYAIILASHFQETIVTCQLPTIAKDWDEVVEAIQQSITDLTASSKVMFVCLDESEDQDGVSYFTYGSTKMIAEYVVTKVEFKK